MHASIIAIERVRESKRSGPGLGVPRSRERSAFLVDPPSFFHFFPSFLSLVFLFLFFSSAKTRRKGFQPNRPLDRRLSSHFGVSFRVISQDRNLRGTGEGWKMAGMFSSCGNGTRGAKGCYRESSFLIAPFFRLPHFLSLFLLFLNANFLIHLPGLSRPARVSPPLFPVRYSRVALFLYSGSITRYALRKKKGNV